MHTNKKKKREGSFAERSYVYQLLLGFLIAHFPHLNLFSFYICEYTPRCHWISCIIIVLLVLDVHYSIEGKSVQSKCLHHNLHERQKASMGTPCWKQELTDCWRQVCMPYTENIRRKNKIGNAIDCFWKQHCEWFDMCA